jgi:hypothetical protein
MRICNPLPPQETLHQLFVYSIVEGALYWRSNPTSRAGSVNGRRGYARITINYKTYSSHRLVWAYFYGDPGPQLIDHINRTRDDDRIENLRIATEAENRRSSSMYRTNTSGFKGVTFEKSVGRWKAYIYLNNRRKHLGVFSSKEEAAEAYAKAAAELHGEFVGARI